MKNELLRHTLATINYRFNKAVKYRDAEFGRFSLGNGSRTPAEIIHHMYSVLKWTVNVVEGREPLKDRPPLLDLNGEIQRFNSEVAHLDKVLAEVDLSMAASKKLLQGPLSDILTHIGQISMLSRLHGRPIAGEDFSSAPIRTGEIRDTNGE